MKNETPPFVISSFSLRPSASLQLTQTPLFVHPLPLLEETLPEMVSRPIPLFPCSLPRRHFCSSLPPPFATLLLFFPLFFFSLSQHFTQPHLPPSLDHQPASVFLLHQQRHGGPKLKNKTKRKRFSVPTVPSFHHANTQQPFGKWETMSSAAQKLLVHFPEVHEDVSSSLFPPLSLLSHADSNGFLPSSKKKKKTQNSPQVQDPQRIRRQQDETVERNALSHTQLPLLPLHKEPREQGQSQLLFHDPFFVLLTPRKKKKLRRLRLQRCPFVCLTSVL